MTLDYAKPRSKRSIRTIVFAMVLLAVLVASMFLPIWPRTGFAGRTYTTFWQSDYFPWRIG